MIHTPRHPQLATTCSQHPERAPHKDAPCDDALGVLGRGDVVDAKYRVLSKLGEGGFGSVFLVEHIFLGQHFAMKLLHNTIAGSPEWVERFRQEARATSMIGHEGIVFVTDFGFARSAGYYFVMEHLEGETLEAKLKHELPMAPDRVVRLAIAISSALAAVHDIGVVHCDLKPSNLILTTRADGSEAPKILDFGVSHHIARAQDPEESVIGTPAYMAPEQTLSRCVDRRADQFSLAVILYELLTGRCPWHIKSWEDAMPFERARSTPRPPSAFMPAGGNEEIDGVLLRALSVDPVKRWPDIQSFAWGLAMASGVEWSALPDPWDRANASRSPGSRTRHPLAPVVAISHSNPAAQSMMVYVDTGGWGLGLDAEESEPWFGPMLSVHFRTSERLRREWRRNLLAGALFVPTPCKMEVGEQVGVRLIYEPMIRELMVCGTISSRHDEREAQCGLGIRFGSNECAQINAFLKSLKLGVRYRNEDVVLPLRELREHDGLGVSEAFLATRLDQPTSIATVRQLCQGLSIEFDDAMRALVHKGLFLVRPGDLSGDIDVPPKDWQRGHFRTQRVRVVAQQTLAAIEETLARVEYFVSTTNYLAAIGILYKSLEVFPTEAQLHYRLGMLHAQFEHDFERAQQLIETAIRLDPVELRYHMAMEYLDTLLLNKTRADGTASP